MDALPEAFVERYSRVYGSREALARNMAEPPRPAARVNALRAPDADAVAERLRAAGVFTEPVPWWPRAWFLDPGASVGNTPEHALGQVYGMDAASLLPALALRPRPGERVLDLAAAPGSKTGLLAELMGGRGLLVANDVVKGRAYNMVSNLQRLGALNAVVTIRDGGDYRFIDGAPRFDRVLVDAPCTNLGSCTLDAEPRIWGHARVAELTGQQRRLLKGAYEMTRPGGVIVYSTCTIEPLENEGVATWFAERFDVALEPHGVRGVDGAAPFQEFDGHKFHPDVARTLRVHPEAHGTEGFFVARFRRAGEAEAAAAQAAPAQADVPAQNRGKA